VLEFIDLSLYTDKRALVSGPWQRKPIGSEDCNLIQNVLLLMIMKLLLQIY